MSSKKLAILRNIAIPAPTAEPADWAKAENATGVVPLERLGAGTPDSTKFLRGDNQWAEAPSGDDAYAWATDGNTDKIPAAKMPDFAASRITSGRFDTARLGSGTAGANTFLRGDGTWAEPPPPPAVREPYSARETLGILGGDGFLHVPAQSVSPLKYFMEHEIPAGSLKANSKLLMFLQLTAVSTTANTYYSILLWLQQSTDGGATWSSASGGFGSFFSSLGTEYETQTIPAIVDPPDNSSTAIRYKIRYYHYINQQASKIADASLHVVEI